MRHKIYNIMILSVGLFLFASCEIHDPIDDLVRPGYRASNVYWEIGSANVTAGSDIPFTAQYWVEESDISYVGVWYNVQRSLNYSFTYGGNVFTFTHDTVAEVREFQEIKTIQHSPDFYSPEKKAYVLEETFPTSYTLSSLVLEEASVFSLSNTLVNQVVPANLKEMFYKQLFDVLNYEQLKEILVTANELIDIEAFDAHFENVLVEDGAEVPNYTMVMKPDSKPVLYAFFQQVPFPSLVYDKVEQFYRFNYSSVYVLNSQLKVTTSNGTENASKMAAIELR